MNGRNREILRTLTVARAWNYLLLNTSFWLSGLMKKPVHFGTPFAISIEPTTACNLRCPQCPSGLRQFTRPQGNLKPDVNKRILDEVGGNLQYINYYFQGEPFIHPGFSDLVREARSRNIYVATSTNAHFISTEKAEEIIDSGLSELIVSIDGTTQETYEKYRIEGKLDKVLEGTRNLVEAKQRKGVNHPLITFQFLVTRHNESQIERLHQIAEEMGVDDVRLKTIQVYDFESGSDLLPETPRYSRYSKKKDGNVELKNKFKNRCWRLWSSCVFTWDGKIVPCCFDKDATHQMGEIGSASFRSIWKSSVYNGFRKQVLKNRREIEICKNCSEGSKILI